MKEIKKMILRNGVSFLIGSVLLVFCSFIQKLIAGYNAFLFMGYLIPIVFGGVSGVIVGIYIDKVRELNSKLQQRVGKLEKILLICSNCKKIKKLGFDPQKKDSWVQIETYISNKTSSDFSHGICPDCMKKLYGETIGEK